MVDVVVSDARMANVIQEEIEMIMLSMSQIHEIKNQDNFQAFACSQTKIFHVAEFLGLETQSS